MEEQKLKSIAAHLRRGKVASLGTLHNGEPAVSMVPYALVPETGHFVLHVSQLATHTQDMERHPRVSIMVVADWTGDEPVQALARASLACDAIPCVAGASEYASARSAYVRKFPDSEPMFDFGDFSLFLLVPRTVRFVGGFGKAWAANAAQYREAMALLE
jgi:heme iron utilization protein